MHKMPPSRKTHFGEVRIIDSRNFPVANTIAAAHVIVKPGGYANYIGTRMPTSSGTMLRARDA